MIGASFINYSRYTKRYRIGFEIQCLIIPCVLRGCPSDQFLTTQVNQYRKERIIPASSVSLTKITKGHIIVFSFLLAAATFLLQVFQLQFDAFLLPMIGARQPSGLNYWSLLTAAYRAWGRSKHDESWARRSNCGKWTWWVPWTHQQGLKVAIIVLVRSNYTGKRSSLLVFDKGDKFRRQSFLEGRWLSSRVTSFTRRRSSCDALWRRSSCDDLLRRSSCDDL